MHVHSYSFLNIEGIEIDEAAIFFLRKLSSTIKKTISCNYDSTSSYVEFFFGNTSYVELDTQI